MQKRLGPDGHLPLCIQGLFPSLSVVFPALPEDAREKPEPQFLLEGSCPVPAQIAAGHLKSRACKCSIQVSWNAGYMGHCFEVDSGCLRRFHVQAGALVENSATDAMPVIPSAKVLLIQAAGWNAVIYYQLWCIEPYEARRSGTHAP